MLWQNIRKSKTKRKFYKFNKGEIIYNGMSVRLTLEIKSVIIDARGSCFDSFSVLRKRVFES